VVFVNGNDENRVYSPTTSLRVGVLEELFDGSLAVIDDNDFQRARPVSLIELEFASSRLVGPWTSGARFEKVRSL
jgi:hypothetical protein